MLERDVEAYLIKRVSAAGGEVRKVKWIGRRSAPDRLILLPQPPPELAMSQRTGFWVELKNPETIRTFPADFRERAQHREHERMRALGERVEVVGTLEQVNDLFA